jgi:hypothetical protein
VSRRSVIFERAHKFATAAIRHLDPGRHHGLDRLRSARRSVVVVRHPHLRNPASTFPSWHLPPSLMSERSVSGRGIASACPTSRAHICAAGLRAPRTPAPRATHSSAVAARRFGTA